jgi:GNAT superfamily N-acetyltransferase
MLCLRIAVAADAMAVAVAVAEVHGNSWQDGYRGLLPDEYLDALRPEDRARHYNFDASRPEVPVTIVALRDESICGFASFGPTQDSSCDGFAELLALYVDPHSWRSGIGTHLMADARRRLADQGFAEAVLWVLDGNKRAASFYAADGWVPDGTTRQDEVWGLTVDQARYRRSLP